MFFHNLKKKKLLKAHRKIGFPPFTQDEQASMMANFDFSEISALTNEMGIIPELLDHYIFIGEHVLADYISRTGFLKKLFRSELTTDYGIWIYALEPERYRYVDQERGKVYEDLCFSSLEEIAAHLAKIKLQYIPKYAAG